MEVCRKILNASFTPTARECTILFVFENKYAVFDTLTFGSTNVRIHKFTTKRPIRSKQSKLTVLSCGGAYCGNKTGSGRDQCQQCNCIYTESITKVSVTLTCSVCLASKILSAIYLTSHHLIFISEIVGLNVYHNSCVLCTSYMHQIATSL